MQMKQDFDETECNHLAMYYKSLITHPLVLWLIYKHSTPGCVITNTCTTCALVAIGSDTQENIFLINGYRLKYHMPEG